MLQDDLFSKLTAKSKTTGTSDKNAQKISDCILFRTKYRKQRILKKHSLHHSIVLLTRESGTLLSIFRYSSNFQI